MLVSLFARASGGRDIHLPTGFVEFRLPTDRGVPSECECLLLRTVDPTLFVGLLEYVLLEGGYMAGGLENGGTRRYSSREE